MRDYGTCSRLYMNVNAYKPEQMVYNNVLRPGPWARRAKKQPNLSYLTYSYVGTRCHQYEFSW